MTGQRFTKAQRAAIESDVLRLWRQGLTQQQIAKQVGVSQPTIHHWLKRLAPPLTQRIAEHLREQMQYNGCVCDCLGLAVSIVESYTGPGAHRR